MVKDIYHNTVKIALIKDGWKVTHDPFILSYAGRNLFADLAAEKFIAAEKDVHKIVVEVKSFIGHSIVKDLQQAIGQYIIYSRILHTSKILRELYLAVPDLAYENIFKDDLGELFINDGSLNLIVFDTETEVITQWITN